MATKRPNDRTTKPTGAPAARAASDQTPKRPNASSDLVGDSEAREVVHADGMIVIGKDLDDLLTGRRGDAMPLIDLLRGWRNACDLILGELTRCGPAVVMVDSWLWQLQHGTLSVMRRAKSLGVDTPRLADLRAVLADLRATAPALQLPALFVKWEEAAPTLAPRLRVAIRRARPEVDAIETSDVDGPPSGTVPIDPSLDPTCKRIRAALTKEPLGLKLKQLVARCGGEQHRTTIKNRLKLMSDVTRAARGIYTLKGR